MIPLEKQTPHKAENRNFCVCPLCNHTHWHMTNKHLFLKDYLMEKIKFIPFCPKHQLKFRVYSCDYCGNTILLKKQDFKNQSSLPVIIPEKKYHFFPLFAAIGAIGMTGSFIVYKFSKQYISERMKEIFNYLQKHSRFK